MEDERECYCNSILVVEDDDDIRSGVVDLLESEGYLTHGAAHGQEAIDILNKIPKPCLVFLDMMMPIMNGREFLDVVMKDSYLAPIPVVVVSAIADRTDIRGAVGYVKKPIDIDVMLNFVERFCGGKRTDLNSEDSAQSHPSL